VPIRDVRDIEISLYPEDKLEVGTARPACVGSIIQIRPSVTAVVTFLHTDFDRLWSLALSGHLKTCASLFHEAAVTEGANRQCFVLERTREVAWGFRG
jgi:hypothetical protein